MYDNIYSSRYYCTAVCSGTFLALTSCSSSTSINFFTIMNGSSLRGNDPFRRNSNSRARVVERNTRRGRLSRQYMSYTGCRTGISRGKSISTIIHLCFENCKFFHLQITNYNVDKIVKIDSNNCDKNYFPKKFSKF